MKIAGHRNNTKRKDVDAMGRLVVDVEITNDRDLALVENGYLEPAKIRRVMVPGVIDSGATRMVLPESLVKALGLPVKQSKTRVTYANGRSALRAEVSNVHVRILGRASVFDAVVEPKRNTALIGAVILETLDFLVDCSKQRLLPRDPDHIMAEIE